MGPSCAASACLSPGGSARRSSNRFENADAGCSHHKAYRPQGSIPKFVLPGLKRAVRGLELVNVVNVVNVPGVAMARSIRETIARVHVRTGVVHQAGTSADDRVSGHSREVVLGRREPGEPKPEQIKNVEGWIPDQRTRRLCSYGTGGARRHGADEQF